jgi:hypothetical protein
MSAKLFSKFKRPDQPRRGIITDRDLRIVETIFRYRFSPTSELVRLVGGNEDVTHRRLRCLWEWGYINRVAFPGIRTHSEFIYYLDRAETLELLVERARLSGIHPQRNKELRLNREAGYANAAVSGHHMKLGFLRHALMISRLHFMLEMSCRKSRGGINLTAWRQGADLRGQKVPLPEIKARRLEESNAYVWEEQDRTRNFPVEPDALFSLQFCDRSPDRQLVHCCYEADRGSMPMADMLKKLRAYYHLIKRMKKHRERFGVHPIRAVLIETTDESRARSLMEMVRQPIVVGASKRSALFWFIISPLFTKTVGPPGGKQIANYLIRPEVVLDSLWAMSDTTLHALGDSENNPQ